MEQSLERVEGGRVRPETIRGPEELRDLSVSELETLADDVRAFLLANVSKTGGHIGANLGTVELTIALHKAFRSPADAILFDTGHQGYTHRILTGRADRFPTLHQKGGMGRFLSAAESEHDPIEASHAGTSVSVGLGMALGRRLSGDPGAVVCVIGDGSLAEGMAFEGLNHAAVEDVNMVIVLNDNGDAESPGSGGLHEALAAGPARAGAFFSALGLAYVGPVDGHDVGALLDALEEARRSGKVPVVHAKTRKGHGWPAAEEHPCRRHFSPPFDALTGDALTGEVEAGQLRLGYPDVTAAVLEEEMERDESIVVVTPSSLHTTGLADVFGRFSERCFDPGMEQQHALALTTGLALAGRKPVVAFQSTYLQRAFDQLVHDVCFANLPTLVLSFRSGFAGYDGPTHHGLYDLAYLRGLPNLRLMVPKDRHEAERMVQGELAALAGPTMILLPHGPAADFGGSVLHETEEAFLEPELDYEGGSPLVVAVGNRYGAALEAVEALRDGGIDAGLLNLRYLKPLPDDFLAEVMADATRVVTLEEGVLEGGLGSAVASVICDRGLRCELLRIGLPTVFVEPGSNDELAAAYRLDAAGVLDRIASRWPRLSVAA